jgi:hypothetical protein
MRKIVQPINFDLGSSLTIDALAFWATDNGGSVKQFELFGDGGQIGGIFNALSSNHGADPAQVFNFGAVTTQHVQLLALSPGGGPTGMGEVAFESTASVPEPSTLGLIGFGLLSLGAMKRRRYS